MITKSFQVKYICMFHWIKSQPSSLTMSSYKVGSTLEILCCSTKLLLLSGAIIHYFIYGDFSKSLNMEMVVFPFLYSCYFRLITCSICVSLQLISLSIIFNQGFCCCWVVGVLYVFWIVTPYQKYHLQISSSVMFVSFLFWSFVSI